MASETKVERGSTAKSVNGISRRTMAYGNSESTAIYFRARDLRNRYAGTTNAERQRNVNNVRRINRAMERLINSR